MDEQATMLEIISTRAMVTALGMALVKKGIISGSDVHFELHRIIGSDQVRQTDPLLKAELENIAEGVLRWGGPTFA